MAVSAPEILSAPLNVGFDYTRSTGPVLGHFVNALRERRVEGIRGSDGRVHAPPVEYDPVTAEALTEFVPVAEEGTVVSWSWCAEPLDSQPLSRPFAWALIRLDGADTTSRTSCPSTPRTPRPPRNRRRWPNGPTARRSASSSRRFT